MSLATNVRGFAVGNHPLCEFSRHFGTLPTRCTAVLNTRSLGLLQSGNIEAAAGPLDHGVFGTGLNF